MRRRRSPAAGPRNQHAGFGQGDLRRNRGHVAARPTVVFTGAISGFAAGDALDLTDIAFGANTTLGYSVNAAGTGGTLNVSDGRHNASIALFGQYAAAGFQVGSDQAAVQSLPTRRRVRA